jgi:hypothetical protein
VPEGPGVFHCDEHDVDGLGRALVSALVRGEAVSPSYVASHHDVRRAVPALERCYRRVIQARTRAAV